jgi:hypothetical protein
MKQLDWKSFAIGVLLTTTVMFGTGASTSANQKWDSEQKWEVIVTIGLPDGAGKRLGELGYYPFDANLDGVLDDTKVLWRKRVQ